MSRAELSQQNTDFIQGILRCQTEDLRTRGQQVLNSKHNDRVAMLVEPRDHPCLEGVIRNVMYFLNGMENKGSGSWNLHVFCGLQNEASLKQMFPGWKIRITNLGVANLDTDQHNKLLLQEAFWAGIAEENILVFQTDTMMFRTLPEHFMSYDMIGAHYLNPHEQNKNKQGFNGGFNFRKKSAVLDCLRNVSVEDISLDRKKAGLAMLPTVQYLGKIAEDVYFTSAMNMLSKCLPSQDVAEQFSTEAVYNVNSIGIHAFNRKFFSFDELVNMVRRSELRKYLQVS